MSTNPVNPVYAHMRAESVPLEDISEGYIKNVAFISLRISLMSFFKTAKALNNYMNNITVRDGMTQSQKHRALGVVYAHEAYNAVFHYQNFMELAIKDIRYRITTDDRVYRDRFVDNLDSLINGINNNTIPAEYHFIKTYEDGIRAINTLRNDSVHSGVFILKSEALNELFGKYALPLMLVISRLPLFAGNRYWKYNLDNDDIHPIEDIIAEYKNNATVNEYKIQLLKLIASAAFDNEIFITKKELEEAEHDLTKMHLAAMYGMIYQNRVQKAEKDAKYLSDMNQMDVHECPVCRNKTLVLEQDTYDDDETYYNYTYAVHCTQCGFSLDHYLINKLPNLGVIIEDYSKIHS